jgi:hypothetical protein
MFSHFKVHFLLSLQINRHKYLTLSEFYELSGWQKGILFRTLKILGYVNKIRQKNIKIDTAIQPLPLH